MIGHQAIGMERKRHNTWRFLSRVQDNTDNFPVQQNRLRDCSRVEPYDRGVREDTSLRIEA
jgi:hypothetical protein